MLAERADVAAGTLFRYAASKAEVFLMVANDDVREVIAEGERAARAPGDPAERLTRLVEPMMRLAVERPAFVSTYQREVLFGPAECRYRGEALAVLNRIEELAAGIVADAPHPVDGAVVGRLVFAAVHLQATRVVDHALGLDVAVAELTAQFKAIVCGATTPRQQGKESS